MVQSLNISLIRKRNNPLFIILLAACSIRHSVKIEINVARSVVNVYLCACSTRWHKAKRYLKMWRKKFNRSFIIICVEKLHDPIVGLRENHFSLNHLIPWYLHEFHIYSISCPSHEVVQKVFSCKNVCLKFWIFFFCGFEASWDLIYDIRTRSSRGNVKRSKWICLKKKWVIFTSSTAM